MEDLNGFQLLLICGFGIFFVLIIVSAIFECSEDGWYNYDNYDDDEDDDEHTM